MIPQKTEPPYGDYDSGELVPGAFARLFPSLTFYSQIARTVIRGASSAKKGTFDDEAWYWASDEVHKAFERCGARIRVENTAALTTLDRPFVVIGNHMSTAETFLLASIILPFSRVTFVVKRQLVEIAVFKHIMRSRNPVVVGRDNPREDLRAVLEEGPKRIKDGISLIVFPQRTRSTDFDPKQFNSIGVKLAQRAGAPIVPLALKTDAWQNGKWLKDFGPLDPSKNVHFKFGTPFEPSGRGSEDNQRVIEFISENLKAWKEG